MKKIVRLTEGDLHRIIRNSVKRIIRESKLNTRRRNRVIRESGDLYGHYDDGTPFTNSKKRFHGIPGTVFIYHGEWSDPEVWWDGVELNANDIEESLWYFYKDDCKERGENPTEQGYEDWLEEMGTEYIASQLDDLAWAAQDNP